MQGKTPELISQIVRAMKQLHICCFTWVATYDTARGSLLSIRHKAVKSISSISLHLSVAISRWCNGDRFAMGSSHA